MTGAATGITVITANSNIGNSCPEAAPRTGVPYDPPQRRLTPGFLALIIIGPVVSVVGLWFLWKKIACGNAEWSIGPEEQMAHVQDSVRLTRKRRTGSIGRESFEAALGDVEKGLKEAAGGSEKGLKEAAGGNEKGLKEAAGDKGGKQQLRVVAFAAGLGDDDDEGLRTELRNQNVQDSMILIRKQLSIKAEKSDPGEDDGMEGGEAGGAGLEAEAVAGAAGGTPIDQVQQGGQEVRGDLD